MDSVQRKLIEKIRQEKFGIGTTKCNPLAGMLHEAIVHLSGELYQKDIHFVSELLQNAEDNTYGKGVTPSLELVLTREDIAQVGAPFTFILFNNELGFQPEHVEALCAVGLSTKKGKRNSGYIGEKGIGFKSVFLVTRTPYIVSNGYRIRFTDEPNNTAKLGYVVPEWVEVPTDADLKRVYEQETLPQTMIILPLRPEKVESVREQLKHVSPETLLFLSQLRQLTIREDCGDLSLCITRSDLSLSMKDNNDRCKAVVLNLTVGRNAGHISEQCQYHLVQRLFPVTHPVEQRKEVEDWLVTIAFPFQERVKSGRCNGDIYAFLPSALVSGFPFIVNADFLLVSSRETLKFDSPWNIGILSCIPKAFVMAFNLFLQESSSIESTAGTSVPTVATQHAYRYLPTTTPPNPQLRQVQRRIFEELRKNDIVLVDSHLGYFGTSLARSAIACNKFCKPEMGRLIRSDFHSIMLDANTEFLHVNPVVQFPRLPWYPVDGGVQERYSMALQILGVPDMTEGEYSEFLHNSDWLMKLSDDLYWEVVFFVLKYYGSSAHSLMHNIPLIKYCTEDGSTRLATIDEATSPQGLKIYMSPSQDGQWFTEWTTVFKPWVSVQFMPQETVENLQQKSGKKSCALWTHLNSVVKTLSVESYLHQLLGLLPTSNDPAFVILTTEFMYQCVQEKKMKLRGISRALPSNFPVVDESGCIQIPHTEDSSESRSVLLPAHGSKWPTLRINSWYRYREVLVMSNDYVTPPSTWSSRSKSCLSRKQDPIELESFRMYLKHAIGAADLPEFTPPRGATSCRMPKHLSSNMTVEQAHLLLQWLSWSLKDYTAEYHTGRGVLITNLTETEWLPTEQHGLRRPSSCFHKSLFSTFLESSDVPYVNESLSGLPASLRTLGVVTDVQRGCDAIVDHMIEMCKIDSQTCDLSWATRMYTCLQKFVWKPKTICATVWKPKIFVPASTGKTSDMWRETESCIIHNVEGFFNETLTVLEDLYPESLLNFFAGALMVPKQATVERYCDLWLKWRSDVREISVEECTSVWKIISEKWKSCDVDVWRTFRCMAWVPSAVQPSSGHRSVFQLSHPSVCFIPDDIDLRSVFSTCLPSPHFVWYPRSSEKLETQFNEVYAALGVKKLSLSVQSNFIVGLKSEMQNGWVSGSGIICEGLFRAILGFLARKKYALPSSSRQDLVRPLKNVVEVTITGPLQRTYSISSLSVPLVATQVDVVALWSRTEGKLYCLDKENPVLQTHLSMWIFSTQLASTIANGLLYEHSSIIEDLTDFLKVLAYTRFESSHVEYELRRKNAQLYEEDELFLSQL